MLNRQVPLKACPQPLDILPLQMCKLVNLWQYRQEVDEGLYGGLSLRERVFEATKQSPQPRSARGRNPETGLPPNPPEDCHVVANGTPRSDSVEGFLSPAHASAPCIPPHAGRLVSSSLSTSFSFLYPPARGGTKDALQFPAHLLTCLPRTRGDLKGHINRQTPKCPLQFLIQKNKKCQRYGTYTMR